MLDGRLCDSRGCAEMLARSPALKNFTCDFQARQILGPARRVGMFVM
jgi:hypothetical protein